MTVPGTAVKFAVLLKERHTLCLFSVEQKHSNETNGKIYPAMHITLRLHFYNKLKLNWMDSHFIKLFVSSGK